MLLVRLSSFLPFIWKHQSEPNFAHVNDGNIICKIENDPTHISGTSLCAPIVNFAPNDQNKCIQTYRAAQHPATMKVAAVTSVELMSTV